MVSLSFSVPSNGIIIFLNILFSLCSGIAITGISDCLIREWKEELDLDIEILEHFYTCDFFQKSAFDDSQIISIYYKVRPNPLSKAPSPLSNTPLDNNPDGLLGFRWIALEQLAEESVSLPIDKKVVSLLQQR